MSDEQITKEQYEALQAENAATKAELDKLKNIFDERQTKQLKKEDVLKKEDILKVLGFNAEDKTVDPLAAINEKLSSYDKTLTDLTEKLSKSEMEKLQVLKQAKVKDELSKYNFVDNDLVAKLVDADSATLADDIKKIAEERKYLLKVNPSFGGGNKANTTLSDKNPYSKATFNLTKQAMIEKENPILAAQLKAQRI